jgi:hypothetical protein
MMQLAVHLTQLALGVVLIKIGVDLVRGWLDEQN